MGRAKEPQGKGSDGRSLDSPWIVSITWFSCRFVLDDAMGMLCIGHVGEGLDHQVRRSIPPEICHLQIMHVDCNSEIVVTQIAVDKHLGNH